MGDYTGVALHLQFPKDISEQLKAFLDSTFNLRNSISTTNLPVLVDIQSQLCSKKIKELDSHFFCASAYFSAWQFSFFRFHKEFDCYIVESRSSLKSYRADSKLVLDFLTLMTPHLLLRDGQIIARMIYEYATTEEVVYYDLTTGQLKIGEGYTYPEGNYDSNHPTEIYDSDCSWEDDVKFAANMVVEFDRIGYTALGFIPSLDIKSYLSKSKQSESEVVWLAPRKPRIYKVKPKMHWRNTLYNRNCRRVIVSVNLATTATIAVDNTPLLEQDYNGFFPCYSQGR